MYKHKTQNDFKTNDPMVYFMEIYYVIIFLLYKTHNNADITKCQWDHMKVFQWFQGFIFSSQMDPFCCVSAWL